MSHPYRDALKRQLIRNEAGTEDYLDFQIRCIRKFGPAAGVFLRQHVYWIGKEHDKDGWVYKTEAEMEEETGLSRRYQREARKILGANGVLEEKKQGIPCQLWYWVDLEALHRIMETPYSTMNQWKRKQGTAHTQFSQDDITDLSWEVDSTVPASEYANTDHASEYGSNALASEDDINGRPITESTSETTAESSSENYSSENRPFQVRTSRASHGSTTKGDVNIGNLKTPIDNRELNRIYPLLTTSGTEAYRAHQRHREGRLSLEDLASEVCHALTGSHERAESYIEPVERWVAELAIGEPVPDQPIRAE